MLDTTLLVEEDRDIVSRKMGSLLRASYSEIPEGRRLRLNPRHGRSSLLLLSPPPSLPVAFQCRPVFRP